ncbi:NodT family efflux transporter outer membrane factor (OMF) lipoprotein [Variovorax paradoxus]|uniref:NodT family efflux transporter outer membrane factor (OMF) lipoprotein n=2 Tax=Variovorax paradoxus TaxID=34073 RepID=A0AAE3XYS8_VARPD|nr:NodT family efflux transporter outer membrane factor (OMF) lipoprotein [Variovorax paradoxus]MDR6426041.1 NodT family efflux transporter outer membrane factor (OMF) lipoprotein [Variovorax paradoxus]
MTHRQRILSHLPGRLSALALAAVLAGCAVGPAYEVPTSAAPAGWKEQKTAEGWLPAAPADALDRGEWWKLFGDATLDELAARVQVSNQNIAAAVANYAQAQALVRGERAALFPTVSLDGSGRRSGNVGGTSNASNGFSATLGVDWAPDVWGRLRQAVSSAQANAQASEADLASARLSAVGDLATNYFSLREADAEIVLLDQTIEGYQRAFEITSNRYKAGIAAQTDVLQAQTQLVSAQAERVGLQRTRATLEHAIAMLVGVAPADFSLPPAQWTPTVPGIPTGVPSTLLQRRPDIAAAERAVAAANAQIGIARSAYFPNFGLSASVGSSASRVKDLFNASNTLWALGLSVAQVVFDAGAIGASVDSAKAAHEASVARYRQTVLTAFQAVEDQLTAGAALAQQEGLRREASAAADKTEQQLLNRYRAAQVSYTEVVTAQAAALGARRTLVQLQVNRQTAAVALIQALGGGWQAGSTGETLSSAPPTAQAAPSPQSGVK